MLLISRDIHEMKLTYWENYTCFLLSVCRLWKTRLLSTPPRIRNDFLAVDEKPTHFLVPLQEMFIINTC